ncbi:MAG: nuclear transport factor 2 family protein [Gemmatimonadota bacterium]|nr:nuclear transport factor 2 family protein [Gemmatimonadota bacterium]
MPFALPEAALTAFHQYLDAYLTRRDVDATMALLAPKFTGIGTAPDEFIASADDARRLYARERTQVPAAIAYQLDEVRARSLSAQVALVEARARLSARVADQPWEVKVRLSVVLEQAGTEWRLAHMHLSEPSHELETGESAPLRVMEARTRQLEQLVAERTAELQERNRELEEALANVNTLSGLIPVCAWCRKVRDDAGFWESVEQFVARRTDADFTHGICPSCEQRVFRT